MFLAEETNGYVNTGLGFGAEKNNPVVYDMLKEYLEEKFFCRMVLITWNHVHERIQCLF